SIPRSTSATCSACSLTGRAIATSSSHRATGASPVLASIVLSWNASSATSRSPSLRFPPQCQRPFPPNCTPRRRRGQAITRQSSTGREHRLQQDDGCHGTVRCGTCASGSLCNENHCVVSSGHAGCIARCQQQRNNCFTNDDPHIVKTCSSTYNNCVAACPP